MSGRTHRGISYEAGRKVTFFMLLILASVTLKVRKHQSFVQARLWCFLLSALLIVNTLIRTISHAHPRMLRILVNADVRPIELKEEHPMQAYMMLFLKFCMTYCLRDYLSKSFPIFNIFNTISNLINKRTNNWSFFCS